MGGNPDIAYPSFMIKQIMDIHNSFEDGIRIRIRRFEQLFENTTLYNKLRSEILKCQLDYNTRRDSHGAFLL
jgi:hypothetical protein